MIDKLQIVLKRQVAFFAVEPRPAAAFPNRGRTRGEEGGFANEGADVEAGGAGQGFVLGRELGGGGVVFFPQEFGFVSRFGNGFFEGFALCGLGCVGGSVPCFTEGGVRLCVGRGPGGGGGLGRLGGHFRREGEGGAKGRRQAGNIFLGVVVVMVMMVVVVGAEEKFQSERVVR